MMMAGVDCAQNRSIYGSAFHLCWDVQSLAGTRVDSMNIWADVIHASQVMVLTCCVSEPYGCF